ncbi:MAG: ATP-binding protein [Victivallales bacterium]|nr:ATP-binding protein [Victivallales bacterium]
MKRFNTTGICVPELHYMVDLTERVKEIKAMVDQGDYFCVNRGRQYGKTTTLEALRKFLDNDYLVLPLSFENIGNTPFEDENLLNFTFMGIIGDLLEDGIAKNATPELSAFVKECLKESGGKIPMNELDRQIKGLCRKSQKPIVLIIDEVDQASNYESFLKFLGVLRTKYLKRMLEPTFHSVILAGVYNIKNLKAKIPNDGTHQYNSPWNIAVDFDIRMELSQDGIVGMLKDYENDHHTGMDIQQMANMLFDYTGGYPFLVSRLCQIMDEKLTGMPGFPDLASCWTKTGFLAAEKIMLDKTNTLFDDLAKKTDDNPELKSLFIDILFGGERIRYSPYDKAQSLGLMFNFIKNNNGFLAISNRIFETFLCNVFTYEMEKKDKSFRVAANDERNQFIKGKRLDMEAVLNRFRIHYKDTFEVRRAQRGSRLDEEDARICFLMFLIPIINGTGHYYIETGLVDRSRMDVVVDYNGEQFVVELKIWRGQAYHDNGIEQLCGYLETMHSQKGYLLTFNFNKRKSTETQTRQCGDKTIVEVMV